MSLRTPAASVHQTVTDKGLTGNFASRRLAVLNISYKLNFGGKVIAQWSSENQTRLPANQIVLIPKDILQREILKPYFRRSIVVSHAETKRGFLVELEAVKMPD